jgi:hypothetical protein
MHYVPILPHRNSVCIRNGHGMRLEVSLEVYSGMGSYVLLPIASHVCLQGQNIEGYQHWEVAHIIKKSKLVKTAVQTEERPSCFQY